MREVRKDLFIWYNNSKFNNFYLYYYFIIYIYKMVNYEKLSIK